MPDSPVPTSLVRVSFDLGPWRAPSEPGWQAAYDDVMASLAAAGRAVYAVLEPGLAPTPLGDKLAGADAVAAEGWLDGYVEHAAAVIQRYAGRVSAFEVLPQPETTAQRGPAVRPQWLAKALTDLQPAVRSAGAAAQARLVACLPDGPQGGVGYLQALYTAGRAGDAWDALAASGAFPLDGVAVRLVVDTAVPDAAAAARGLTELAAALERFEGPTGASKPVFVSGLVLAGAGDALAADSAIAAALQAITNDPRAHLAAETTADMFPGAPPELDGVGRGEADGQAPLLVFFGPADDVEAGLRGPDAETDPPVADGFDYPCGGPGVAEPWDDYYIAADVCDPGYFRLFKGVWHPGEDWNGKVGGDRDLGAPIYAIAHGVVATAKYFPTSWGNVVLLRHALPDGTTVWSQYAHLNELQVKAGDVVRRGDQIGTLGKGAKNKFPAHLHFEVRTTDLSPGNWFPMVRDKDKVLAHYAVAKEFIAAHRPGQQPAANAVTVIVDDADPGFGKADVPNWNAAGTGYGGNAWYTLGARRTDTNVATWSATLPEAGSYQVAVYVPRNHATTENAVYTVVHAQGEATARVNQNRYFDKWVPLGSYAFGTSGQVRLTDRTGEADAWKREVAYDAVRWVKVA